MLHAIISNLLEFSEFLDTFESCGSFLMVGDFNYHLDDLSDSDARKFKDLLEASNLEQHVTVPTHDKMHMLDLVITRAADNLLSSVEVHDACISDHSVIACDLMLHKPSVTKQKALFRKMKGMDMDAFRHDIQDCLPSDL